MEIYKLFFLTFTVLSTVNGFCYKDAECGQTTWSGSCQTGQSQSPIDIHIPKTDEGWERSSKPKEHISFNKAYRNGVDTAVLTNNGHAVQISIYPNATSSMVVQTSLFPGTYIFGQVHCHFDSEHTFSKIRYVLECHFVHYNSSYSSIGAAVAGGEDGALLIIGILYEDKGTSEPDNEFLKPFTDNLGKVTKANTVISIGPVNIFEMQQKVIRPANNEVDGEEDYYAYQATLHKEKGLMDFYSYKGSLTTPGCNEGMNWLVQRLPQPISSSQLQQFWALQNGEKESMKGNYRDDQPLNGRVVAQVRVNVKPESNKN